MRKQSRFGLVMVGISSALLLSMVACGGSATDAGDGDGDSTGDGDATGDGDGDVGDGDGDVGDGDGDIGDGDGSTGGAIGDGDGDGPVCTDVYAYGLSVTVVGGAIDPGGINQLILPPGDGDLAPVAWCYATVVATDGDYEEMLDCYSYNGVDCQCHGAGERPGAYTVTATLGDMVEEQNVVVTADECHVISESLTFFAVK